MRCEAARPDAAAAWLCECVCRDASVSGRDWRCHIGRRGKFRRDDDDVSIIPLAADDDTNEGAAAADDNNSRPAAAAAGGENGRGTLEQE